MISKSSRKSKRVPRPSEAALLAAAAATGLLLLPFLPGRRADRRPEIREVPFRPPTNPRSLFAYPEAGRRLPHFELRIRPEFIRALDAATPKGVKFQKVRYKKVPVESFSLDGSRIPGTNTARYRGYGDLHWGFKQKSIKVQTDKDQKVRGHRTLNLTALSTDPFLFEIWAGEVLHRSGGVTSRVGLATVDLNGRYDGLRQIVENMDMDLLESQNLPKGAIYREREHAKIGRKFLWEAEIRDLWKKNSLQKADWSDLRDFNDAVRESVLEGNDAYLRRVDLPQFVNYYAALILIGTVHLNDHNIPLYRPRPSPKFIPVGYDYGWPGLGDHGLKEPNAQIPYMGMNWLSQLFWSDPKLRGAIHRRAARILERYPDLFDWYDAALDAAEPHVARDLEEGASLTNDPAMKSVAQWRKNNVMREPVRRRLGHLRRGYLFPRARLRPDWRSEKRTQGVIEGLGIYSLRFAAAGPCPDGAVLKVRAHDGDWEEAGRCERGGFTSRELRVERNDLRRPYDGDTMYMTRNTIGAVLLDIDNAGGIPLSGAEIRSLQLDRAIPVRDDWPLLLEDGNPGKLPEGFRFTPLGTLQVKHAYDPATGNLAIQAPRPSVYDWEKIGPVLCWGGEDDGFCHEIIRGYPEDRSAGPGLPDGNAVPALDLSTLATCKRLVFPSGRWRVDAPAVSSPDCTVVFSPDTEIRFTENASLILRGPVEFPRSGRVLFDAEKESWGGVVIDGGGRPVIVQNAQFSHTQEFYYGGERRSGALTILNSPRAVVYKSVFTDTGGDDALHIVGGASTIQGNVFVGTRDAIDIDGGERHTITGNLMREVADDGVDLGNVRSVVIFHNAILGAGDKAVSIGEGSVAAIGINLFHGGNVGVAIKEGCRAVLDKPVIVSNTIGISLYKKLDPNSPSGTVSGKAFLGNNGVPFRIEEGVPPETKPAGPDEIRTAARAVMKKCVLCRADPELQKHVR